MITKQISIPIWCDWKRLRFLPLLVPNYFNSYMVRLEVVSGEKFPPKAWNFNSYMVRLEVIRLISQYPTIVFQFLYGAIGRQCNCVSAGVRNRFQFLYGAIGSGTVHYTTFCKGYFNSYMVRLEESSITQALCKNKISIPIWCDWKLPIILKDRTDNQISIPIWCDWKMRHMFLRPNST